MRRWVGGWEQRTHVCTPVIMQLSSPSYKNVILRIVMSVINNALLNYRQCSIIIWCLCVWVRAVKYTFHPSWNYMKCNKIKNHFSVCKISFQGTHFVFTKNPPTSHSILSYQNVLLPCIYFLYPFFFLLVIRMCSFHVSSIFLPNHQNVLLPCFYFL